MKKLIASIISTIVIATLLIHALCRAEEPSAKEQDINVIKAEFPLHISALDFEAAERHAIAEHGINSAIADYLNRLYKEYGGEEYIKMGYPEYSCDWMYYAGLRLESQKHYVFILFVRQIPQSKHDCKILFFDKATGRQIGQVQEFDLYPLYHIDDENRLVPSNLKEHFKLEGPEFEILNTDDNSVDYRFTRLYHNGTSNAIETLVLKVKSNAIDTLNFDRNFYVATDKSR